jgi:hypothetical protein
MSETMNFGPAAEATTTQMGEPVRMSCSAVQEAKGVFSTEEEVPTSYGEGPGTTTVFTAARTWNGT